MSKKEFIFTREFPQRLYRHVFFWAIYYLFSLVTYMHPFLEKTTFAKWALLEVVEVSCHVATQIIFCYTILYVLWEKLYNKKSYAAFVAGLITVFALTLCLYYLEQVTIFKTMHTYAGLPFMKGGMIYWYGFVSMVSYAPISAGLAIAIKMMKRFYIKQQENHMLIRENANAELQLLKAQVHPHFLFNTLNNIYSFTLNKSMQAPQLVLNLSDTLHYMITDCEADMVPLAQELKMIKDYTDLENVRYGDRLTLEIDIAGSTTGKMIAPLLIIPFVENSFKHGASKLLRGAWINLAIQADEQVLHLTVANSKPAEAATSEKGGIGLRNVTKRLELLYPGNHLLSVERTANTFTVNMQIPLQYAEVENHYMAKEAAV